MPSSRPSPFSRTDRQLAARAAMLALSAWVAFALASIWHVQHAYWAAMPVWVVAQASRGVLLERAFFRVVGTLLGAAVGFLLLQLPVPPYAQLALLALWVAASAGLTHILRGVHSYGALLAGITAPIVVIPAVLGTAGSRELAISRVICTLIGVLTTTVITGLLTPRSPRQAFFRRVRRICGDATAFAAERLRNGPAATLQEERRILAEISELEASARLVLAGSRAGYRRLHDVDSMVVGALSIMATAVAMGQNDPGGATSLPGHLDRVAERLRSAGPPPAEDLHLASVPPPQQRLAEALGWVLEGDAALRGPDGAVRPSLRRLPLARLAPHREWPQALRTGLLAGGATFLASALALGWAGGSLGILFAMGVSIFSMVLGTMALPQDIAPKLLTGVLAGALTAIVYRITVQPACLSTSALLLSIAPFLLFGGILRAHPRTALAGVDANMCFLLASQAGSTLIAPPGTVVKESLALAAGAALMAGGFMLVPRRAMRQAKEAAAVIRSDLRRMLQLSQGTTDPARLEGRALRQILRLSLHLGRAKELGERWPAGLLATLNLGYDLERLMTASVDAPTQEAARAALLRMAEAPREVAAQLRRLAGGGGLDSLRGLLTDLAVDLEQAEGLLCYGLA